MEAKQIIEYLSNPETYLDSKLRLIQSVSAINWRELLTEKPINYLSFIKKINKASEQCFSTYIKSPLLYLQELRLKQLKKWDAEAYNPKRVTESLNNYFENFFNERLITTILSERDDDGLPIGVGEKVTPEVMIKASQQYIQDFNETSIDGFNQYLIDMAKELKKELSTASDSDKKLIKPLIKELEKTTDLTREHLLTIEARYAQYQLNKFLPLTGKLIDATTKWESITDYVIQQDNKLARRISDFKEKNPERELIISELAKKDGVDKGEYALITHYIINELSNELSIINDEPIIVKRQKTRSPNRTARFIESAFKQFIKSHSTTKDGTPLFLNESAQAYNFNQEEFNLAWSKIHSREWHESLASFTWSVQEIINKSRELDEELSTVFKKTKSKLQKIFYMPTKASYLWLESNIPNGFLTELSDFAKNKLLESTGEEYDITELRTYQEAIFKFNKDFYGKELGKILINGESLDEIILKSHSKAKELLIKEFSKKTSLDDLSKAIERNDEGVKTITQELIAALRAKISLFKKANYDVSEKLIESFPFINQETRNKFSELDLLMDYSREDLLKEVIEQGIIDFEAEELSEEVINHLRNHYATLIEELKTITEPEELSDSLIEELTSEQRIQINELIQSRQSQEIPEVSLDELFGSGYEIDFDELKKNISDYLNKRFITEKSEWETRTSEFWLKNPSDEVKSLVDYESFNERINEAIEEVRIKKVPSLESLKELFFKSMKKSLIDCLKKNESEQIPKTPSLNHFLTTINEELVDKEQLRDYLRNFKLLINSPKEDGLIEPTSAFRINDELLSQAIIELNPGLNGGLIKYGLGIINETIRKKPIINDRVIAELKEKRLLLETIIESYQGLNGEEQQYTAKELLKTLFKNRQGVPEDFFQKLDELITEESFIEVIKGVTQTDKDESESLKDYHEFLIYQQKDLERLIKNKRSLLKLSLDDEVKKTTYYQIINGLNRVFSQAKDKVIDELYRLIRAEPEANPEALMSSLTDKLSNDFLLKDFLTKEDFQEFMRKELEKVLKVKKELSINKKKLKQFMISSKKRYDEMKQLKWLLDNYHNGDSLTNFAVNNGLSINKLQSIKSRLKLDKPITEIMRIIAEYFPNISKKEVRKELKKFYTSDFNRTAGNDLVKDFGRVIGIKDKIVEITKKQSTSIEEEFNGLKSKLMSLKEEMIKDEKIKKKLSLKRLESRELEELITNGTRIIETIKVEPITKYPIIIDELFKTSIKTKRIDKLINNFQDSEFRKELKSLLKKADKEVPKKLVKKLLKKAGVKIKPFSVNKNKSNKHQRIFELEIDLKMDDLAKKIRESYEQFSIKGKRITELPRPIRKKFIEKLIKSLSKELRKIKIPSSQILSNKEKVLEGIITEEKLINDEETKLLLMSKLNDEYNEWYQTITSLSKDNLEPLDEFIISELPKHPTISKSIIEQAMRLRTLMSLELPKFDDEAEQKIQQTITDLRRIQEQKASLESPLLSFSKPRKLKKIKKRESTKPKLNPLIEKKLSDKTIKELIKKGLISSDWLSIKTLNP